MWKPLSCPSPSHPTPLPTYRFPAFLGNGIRLSVWSSYFAQIPRLFPRLYSRFCYQSRKQQQQQNYTAAHGTLKVFYWHFRTPAEARSFHALKMPQLLCPGSLPRAPRVHPAQEAARPRRGIQIGWGSGARSSCRFPGRAARGKGASCHLQLRASVSLVGTEITPSPGRAGRGVGEVGRESQASRGRDSGFLPNPATPGGHRGSLGPLPSVCGLMCTLGGGPQEVAAPERRHRLLGGAVARSVSFGWASRRARPRATHPGHPCCFAQAVGTKRPRPPQAVAPSPHPLSVPPPSLGRSKQETHKI